MSTSTSKTTYIDVSNELLYKELNSHASQDHIHSSSLH